MCIQCSVHCVFVNMFGSLSGVIIPFNPSLLSCLSVPQNYLGKIGQCILKTNHDILHAVILFPRMWTLTGAILVPKLWFFLQEMLKLVWAYIWLCIHPRGLHLFVFYVYRTGCNINNKLNLTPTVPKLCIPHCVFIFGTACQIYCCGRYCVRRSVSPQVPENPSGPLVDNFIVLPCVAFGVACVKLLPGVDRWNSLDDPRVIGPCLCEVWGWPRH